MRAVRFLLIQIASFLSAASTAAPDIDIDSKASPEIHQAYNCSTFLRSRYSFRASTPEEPFEILTPRLILRNAADSDYNEIKNVFSDIDTLRNLYGVSQQWTSRHSMRKHQDLMSGLQQAPIGVNWLRTWGFVIALRENNKMIGSGAITQYRNRWETSVVIAPAYRNVGYSTERLAAVIRFVREMDPNARFHTNVAKTNFESQAVMRNLKFKRDRNDLDPETFSYWLEPEDSNR